MSPQMMVLAVLLGLVGADSGSSCTLGCRLTNITIDLERKDCGPKTIQTTSCAGQCETKEPNFITANLNQSTCSFQEMIEQTYHFDDCKVDFKYLEAKSCKCKACSPTNTECDSLPMSRCFQVNL